MVSVQVKRGTTIKMQVRRADTPLLAGSKVGAPEVGNGPSVSVGDMVDKRIQLSGAFGGGWSVTLQGSIDGVTWTDLQVGVNTTTTVEAPEWWCWLRLVTVATGTLIPLTGATVEDQADFTCTIGGRRVD